MKLLKNRGYDRYQGALASMVYSFFDNKTRSEINANKQLS